MAIAVVATFAVHDHRTRVDQPADLPAPHRAKQYRSTEAVGTDVVVHVIEVHAEPDLCGQMDDGVDSLERLIDDSVIADVSDDQAVQRRSMLMDVCAERVEDDDIMALGN
jgi:hypothetical protein